MTEDPRDRRPRAANDDWDRLDESIVDRPAAPSVEPTAQTREDDGYSVIPAIASSWGDLAAMLGLCAAALIALKVSGHGAPFAAAPWAGALAVLWWLAASAVLVAVRRGTPGMLMAGLRFDAAVPPGRIPAVLLTALLLAATLGLPSAVGRAGWALQAAAATPVVAAGRELP